MDYTIRLAQKTDVPLIADIEKAAAKQFMPYLDWLGISANLLESLTSVGFMLRAQSDERLWVAAVEDRPVGFIVVKFLRQSCFVVELDVHPDYGRRGIGSALVNACVASAQTKGFDDIILTTFRKVPWNIPFYERLGFEIWSEAEWPFDIEAIVQHEERYGFARDKRAVMRKRLLQG
ncbi:MAG: GNAT family N-acetyltransferase [Cyanobacteria bacterium P01_A01_bin.116]